MRQNYLDVGDKILEITKSVLDEIKAQQASQAINIKQTTYSNETMGQSVQSLRRLISPQEKLRTLIMKIPKGKVTTYGWLAKQIYGNTGATPAVLSMIKSITGTSAPCHRVVSSDGQPKAPDADYGN